MENTEDLMRAARQNLRIAHHVAGRIRLKFNPQHNFTLPQLQQLKSVFEQAEGILSLKINVLAKSIVLEYDFKTIDPRAFDDFLSGLESDFSRVIINFFK